MKFLTGGEGLAHAADASAPASDAATNHAERASPETNRCTGSWYHAPLRFARFAIWTLGACLSCSAAHTATPPTASSAAAPPESAALPNHPDWFERARVFPLVNDTPFRSAHFGRPHSAVVRVNPEASSTYRDVVPGTEFSPGTLLVEWLRDQQSGQTGPILALERREDSWCFWVLRPDGRVQSSGELEPCAGCHAGAPAAPVFGIPRAP